MARASCRRRPSVAWASLSDWPQGGTYWFCRRPAKPSCCLALPIGGAPISVSRSICATCSAATTARRPRLISSHVKQGRRPRPHPPPRRPRDGRARSLGWRLACRRSPKWRSPRGIGAVVNQLTGGDPIPQFFGEDQGRYLVTVRQQLPSIRSMRRSIPIPACSCRGSALPAAPRSSSAKPGHPRLRSQGRARKSGSRQFVGGGGGRVENTDCEQHIGACSKY